MPSIIKVVKVDVTSAQALVWCCSEEQLLTVPAMIAIYLLHRI